MKLITRTPIQDPPMSDTRHLSDLKFDERPLSQSQPSQVSTHVPEGMQTDMVMLKKADAWMGQFKTRLNISIIALVVVWGSVSYYKSTVIQLAAHAAAEPERILADGSAEDETIPTVEVDSLQRDIPVETVEAIETEKVVETEKAEIKPAPVVKKPAVQKTVRAQKKLKKNVASKPATR